MNAMEYGIYAQYYICFHDTCIHDTINIYIHILIVFKCTLYNLQYIYIYIHVYIMYNPI